MKLIVSLSALAVAHAKQNGALLNAMNALSDECVGCENAPEDPYTCDQPPCDSAVCGKMATKDCDESSCAIDCSLPTGYYADPEDCTKYCFCTGAVDDGTGISVPSRYMSCPAGTFWDNSCSGFHDDLANGLGYAGGCCNHAAAILNFKNCPGGCERLSKYHCAKSETCCFNEECNCCQSCEAGEPIPEPRPACVNQPLDLTFILDGSGSVGAENFVQSKLFMKKVVSRLGAESRVACVQYSTDVATEFTYTNDYASIYNVINTIPYQGKSTETGMAMKYTADNVIVDRRPDVKNIVLVLTDGVSYDDAANDVSIRGPELQASNGGVDVLAVGVAKADRNQLLHIASSEEAVYMKGWEELQDSDFLDTLADQVCA